MCRTYPGLPDAARCLSGRRSNCSRRSPSPWIFCTAHPGAASRDAPSPCSPWPGRQGNTGLGGWIEENDQATEQRKQKAVRTSKLLEVQKEGKVSGKTGYGKEKKIPTLPFSWWAPLRLIWSGWKFSSETSTHRETGPVCRVCRFQSDASCRAEGENPWFKFVQLEFGISLNLSGQVKKKKFLPATNSQKQDRSLYS